LEIATLLSNIAGMNTRAQLRLQEVISELKQRRFWDADGNQKRNGANSGALWTPWDQLQSRRVCIKPNCADKKATWNENF